MTYKPTSTTLTALRNLRGLNQSELSRRAGLAGSWVSQIECGRREPNIETLRRLCEALGCTPNDIIWKEKVER